MPALYQHFQINPAYSNSSKNSLPVGKGGKDSGDVLPACCLCKNVTCCVFALTEDVPELQRKENKELQQSSVLTEGMQISMNKLLN